MTLTVVSEKFNSDPGDSSWTIAHQFKDDNPERGALFVIFRVNNESQNQDRIRKNREILSLIQKEYYGNSTLTPFNALKQSVDKTTTFFSQEFELAISAVSVVNSVIYAASSNGGQVLIYRNSTISKILQSDKVTISASGFPKSKDVLIIATPEFLTHISESELHDVLKSSRVSDDLVDLEKAVDKLRFSINKKDSNVSVYFIEFGNLKKIEKVSFSENILPQDPVTPATAISTKKASVFSKLSFKSFPRRISVKKQEVSIAETTEPLKANKKTRKLTMSVGIITLLLLIVSIGFGAYQKDKDDKQMVYLPRLKEAQYSFEEALNLFNLSPERARENFLSSKEKVDQLVAEGIEDLALTSLVQDIDSNQGRILGEYTTLSESFIDLSLLSDGFSGQDISVSDNVIYVLDREKDRVVSVAIDTKKSEVIAGPGAVSDAYTISSFSDRVYVNKEDGIYKIESGKEKVVDEELDSSIIFSAYAGNLYVIDTLNSQILRYPAFEGGFADGSSWLREGAEPDLTKIVSVAIDGAIWMVSKTGRVFKFLLGNQVNFSVNGLFPQISDPKVIFTNEELEFLYILEPSKQRIVVLTKEGDFVAQYVSEGLSRAIDLAVSEEDKKMIFLTGEKLEFVEIEHL